MYSYSFTHSFYKIALTILLVAKINKTRNTDLQVEQMNMCFRHSIHRDQTLVKHQTNKILDLFAPPLILIKQYCKKKNTKATEEYWPTYGAGNSNCRGYCGDLQHCKLWKFTNPGHRVLVINYLLYHVDFIVGVELFCFVV